MAGLSRRQALSSMPDLSPLVQDRDIIFTGKLDRYSMIKLCQKVKCGLIPSFYEAFPYGILELFACGTPVVGSSTIPGNVLRDGYCGFRLLPEDFSVMTKCVLKLLIDDKLWKRMSQNAQRIANMFSIAKVAQHVINVYHSISHARK